MGGWRNILANPHMRIWDPTRLHHAPLPHTIRWPATARREGQPTPPFWPAQRPQSDFQAFDGALGRGYRIGDITRVDALAGIGTRPFGNLTNHGTPNRVGRWKITLAPKFVDGVDPNGPMVGERIVFHVLARMENDIIDRPCTVSIGDAQVVYAPGRSLSVTAENENSFPIDVHWNIDEVTAGLSQWENSEFFVDLAVETALAFPPFCDAFEVFSPGGGAAGPRVRGYGPGGTLFYDATLAVPDSGPIRRVPGLDYTIDVSGPGLQTHAVLFICNG